MRPPLTSTAAIIPFKLYVSGLAALWTSMIGVLFWVDINADREERLDIARAEARGRFDWYMVYMQPAYMTQEFHQAGRAQQHITSLKPRRPENAPDSWETAALQAFVAGAKEHSSIEMADGEPVLRYMAPVTMEQGCLQCHRDQGYKPGDMAGGIAVDLPLRQMLAAARAHLVLMILGYGFPWILGLCGLGLGARSVGYRMARARRAEGQLRESEFRWKFAIEGSGDGLWDWNVPESTVFFSTRWKDMLGFAEDEIGNGLDEWSKRIHPDDLVPVMADVQAHLAGTTPLYVNEHRVSCKDGTWKWILDRGVVVSRDAAGQPLRMIGTHSDITERKRAEETQVHLVAILDAMPGFVGFADAKDTKMLYINPFGRKMVGIQAQEDVTQHKIADVHPEWTNKLFRDEIIPTAIRDGVWTGECAFLNRDGHEVPVMMVLLAHKSASGAVDRFSTISMDITERKRAEGERRSLEERLTRAEKMEALGTLAGGVAHDLNNVLGIVVGYSEMLLADVDQSSPLRRGLENVMSGGLRAAAIVDDLLTLARRGVPGRSILNLNTIVTDCQQLPEFEKLCVHHPAVKITTDLEPDLLNISGSSLHLTKSLYNLVSNASEAMAKGGGVTITTTHQYLDRPIQGYDQIRAGDYVVLSVSDTGGGIRAADLKRIFEPFYTKKVMGRSGTGLGLAVVWGTVKDHHGYINVQSEEGKGSTFSLYFPVTREDLPAERVAVAVSEYMGHGESLLVVDDVEQQRDLAAGLLRTLNYTVSSASSGEEAVAYMKEHEVDLIVLDMIMDPGMDGLDTYRSILEIRPRQRAIIVSGFAESDRVHAANRLGAGTYVRKPYIKEKLGLAVRKELDRAV